MSYNQWLALLAVFTAYLLFGGVVFMAVESPLEDVRIGNTETIRRLIYDELITCHDNQSTSDRQVIWEKVADFIGQPSLVANCSEQPKKWTFYNSFFVAVTAASTIGYGHMAPTSATGRLFCIAFALFGIPLNGILFASLGDYFGAKLIRRSQKRCRKPENPWAQRLMLLMDVFLYLIPGLIVFLVIPAAMFSLVEGWTYLDAFYYAFISLTTIGFGDLVAGTSDIGPGTWFYRLVILTWIVFGLGYLVMVINIITRGFRSKPVVALEKKMAARLRATRIRVLRDALLLRQLVNEIQVMKIKPVYRTDTSGQLRRVGSHHMKFDDDPVQDVLNRREASSCRPAPATGLKSYMSDTALNDIDVSATFQNVRPIQNSQETVSSCSSNVDPVKLLARLATALIDDHIDEPATNETDLTSLEDSTTDEEATVQRCKSARTSMRAINETWHYNRDDYERSPEKNHCFWMEQQSVPWKRGKSESTEPTPLRQSIRSNDLLLPPKRPRYQRSLSECQTIEGSVMAQEAAKEVSRNRSFRIAERRKSITEFNQILNQVRLTRKNSNQMQ